MGAAHATRSLLLECEQYLARFETFSPGMHEVLAGLRTASGQPINRVEPRPEPRCGYLDEALALARTHRARHLADAIATARPFLHWITYDGYPRELIGGRFPKAHAFTTIIGATGFAHADDFELGLFLIAPRTLYRDHRHPAPELYAPLTGPTGWRFGPDTPWDIRQAHEPVWNEPLAVHATRVGAEPFLCLYCWTRDVTLPATVVPADDWDEIERAL